MQIGEVAREAGVSRDAVRLYTHLGLVTCASRRAGSRLYADYDPSAVEIVKGIKMAQSIGFTLAELGPIVAAYATGSLDDARQRELLAAKLVQVEDKRHQLGQMSQFLRAKLNHLGTAHQHGRDTAESTPASQDPPLVLLTVTPAEVSGAAADRPGTARRSRPPRRAHQRAGRRDALHPRRRSGEGPGIA
jgi:MerR family transcriptional regulator, copper efflux regulator